MGVAVATQAPGSGPERDRRDPGRGSNGIWRVYEIEVYSVVETILHNEFMLCRDIERRLKRAGEKVEITWEKVGLAKI